MTFKLLTILIMTSLFISSCAHVFEPAFYHEDVAYQPKPASFDSVKTSNYVSIGYKEYSNTESNDDLTLGEFDLSRGHAFKSTNLAYGVFGAIGSYNNTTQHSNETLFNSKYFGGFGARASFNFFQNNGDADFRFLGLETIYSHEFGDYAVFRKSYFQQVITGVDARTDLFTAGLTSEILFGQKKDITQNGFRLFLGKTFGNSYLIGSNTFNYPNQDNRLFFRFSYFGNDDKNSWWK